MSRYILAIDQGTTGTTALLVDKNINVKAKATREFPQHFPKPAWVEHDLNEIWDSVNYAVSEVLKKSGTSPNEIAAIGLTNQRETTCLWKKEEGASPVSRAIVWQDRRTADTCLKLKKQGLEKQIRKTTGLCLDPYFSATKLEWILKNIPGAMKDAKSGKIAFGTVDSFLLYKITGEHKTEPSNASRTLLMNLQSCAWDEDMLRIFKIPKAVLPEICESAVEYGKTRKFLNFPNGIPVCGMAGDQQAALFGQACFEKGSTKSTYGTGAFILMNIGSKPLFSKNKLLTSVAWKIEGETTYCLEGSAFIAGAAVQWLRDGLKLFPESKDVETLASSVASSEGVVFVPALSGMGAPHWLSDARGLITGITRGTTQAHIARATLEGIAFQVWELVEAMSADLGKKIRTLKVDGGAAADELLMQFQADLLGVDIIQSKVLETTALGSALQAGLAMGWWSGTAEISKKWQSSKTFSSKMKAKERREHTDRWSHAIEALTQLSV